MPKRSVKSKSPKRSLARRAKKSPKSPKRRRNLRGGIDVSTCNNDTDPISLNKLAPVLDRAAVRVADPQTGKDWCFERKSVACASKARSFNKNPLTNLNWSPVQKRSINNQLKFKVKLDLDVNWVFVRIAKPQVANQQEEEDFFGMNVALYDWVDEMHEKLEELFSKHFAIVSKNKNVMPRARMNNLQLKKFNDDVNRLMGRGKVQVTKFEMLYFPEEFDEKFDGSHFGTKVHLEMFTMGSLPDVSSFKDIAPFNLPDKLPSNFSHLAQTKVKIDDEYEENQAEILDCD